MDTGRAAVANGETSGIAYFEWAAEPDADPADPATWWSCIPALGHTITEAALRHACSTMPSGEFRRAHLNQWTVSDERVIPLDVWNAVQTATKSPDGKLALSVEVNPERTAAAVGVADSEGTCELADFRPGLGWVVDYVVSTAKACDAPVVIDGYGPAAPLVPDIEARGVRVEVYKMQDMARACAGFYDAVADKQVKIRPDDRLNRAVAAATKRSINDVWVWGRKTATEDVAPLIAVTLAHDKARALGQEPELWFFEE